MIYKFTKHFQAIPKRIDVRYKILVKHTEVFLGILLFHMIYNITKLGFLFFFFLFIILVIIGVSIPPTPPIIHHCTVVRSGSKCGEHIVIFNAFFVFCVCNQNEVIQADKLFSCINHFCRELFNCYAVLAGANISLPQEVV